MMAHRRATDAEAFGDLSVHQPFGDEDNYFALSFGEPGDSDCLIMSLSRACPA